MRNIMSDADPWFPFIIDYNLFFCFAKTISLQDSS